jgi:hypothetical protein
MPKGPDWKRTSMSVALAGKHWMSTKGFISLWTKKPGIGKRLRIF